MSNYIVVDAYFTRYPFMDRVVKAGFHVITRGRADISLRYYYKGKGRKCKCDGKVELTKIDADVFSRFKKLETPRRRVWQGMVNQKSVNLKIKAVIVQDLDDKAETKEVHILRKCGIDPHMAKIQAVIAELKVFGARAG